MRSLSILMTTIALVAIALANAAHGADAPKRPNVLFIAVDDLNHWCGYTGRNPQAKTPNIDRLSRMGVSFANAHCAAPACNPSRAALMSGLRPSTSGCYHNGDPWKQHIPEGLTLNATFKKAGYEVLGIGKIYHSAGPGNVYMSEWDEYPANTKPYGGGADKYQGYFEPLPHDFSDQDFNDWHYVDYCVDQLQKDHQKPFFLACGFLNPHLPWAVPRKYYDMFPVDEIELPPHIDDDLGDVPPAGQKTGIRGDHPKFLELGRWKDAIQSYLATVAYVDTCIGRLLDGFDSSPHKDNTIIVLWGDHGWHLGEKERWRKFTLWEEATRAPLIWYVPGMTPSNRVAEQPVDFMCIYPTLCELASIDLPDHVDGHSIVPLLKAPDAVWDHVAITTHGKGNNAVRTDRWRYIRYANGDEELYDHRDDPFEWANLADRPEHSDVKQRLRAHIPPHKAR